MNSWESEVWRQTLQHEGSHCTALGAYRFWKGKRRPHVPAASLNNGRESATDTRFLPGRNRQSEYSIPSLSRRNEALFESSRRRVQRERKARRGSEGSVPPAEAHWPVESLMVHGGAQDTCDRLAQPHERKRLLVALPGEFQMVHDDGARHRAEAVPIGMHLGSRSKSAPRQGTARAQTAGRAHSRASIIQQHRLETQPLSISQVLPSTETLSVHQLNYAASGNRREFVPAPAVWSVRGNDILKQAVSTCGDGGGKFVRNVWREVAAWVNSHCTDADVPKPVSAIACRRRWYNWDQLDGTPVDQTHDPDSVKGPGSSSIAWDPQVWTIPEDFRRPGSRSTANRRDLNASLYGPSPTAYDVLDRPIYEPPKAPITEPLHWMIRV